ncbi:MAG: hypothetical protein J5478_05015 [Bacteroidales bacterium]|nr:hypothetical protein [Bacteroidales bacterium]
MKSLSVFLLTCLTALLFGCNPIPEIEPGEKPADPESYGELIGTFFVENRNMTLQLYDITDLYKEVCYVSWAVPVNHTRYENLPNELKETVKTYGLMSPTQVYKMKWKGETVYHLFCAVMDDWTGVYKPSGERITFKTIQEYYQFLKEVTDVNCLLLIDTEVVKSAEGAPNLLVGTWQMDWEHLHHDITPNNSGIDDQVALYDDLPFSITEVCHFEANGTGYLRSVKSFKNGKTEVALDPFSYWLTDYQTYNSVSNYQGYSYVCCFAAGDTIEYTARSYDTFGKTFDRGFTFVTYPWYKQKSDPYSNKKGEPKYGVPERDNSSLIVGRWSGVGFSAAGVFGKRSYTWVFRSDGTGYELLGRKIYQSFAYTVEGNNDALQLTIYKYDTGFYTQDGFWKEGDWTYSYVPQPTPKGKVMKARIYDNGKSLELEGFNNTRADLSQTPIVFQRQ